MWYNDKGLRVTEDGILIRDFLEVEEIEYQNNKSFVNPAFVGLEIPGTSIIRTPEQAKFAISVLKKYPSRIHAWDTETIGIDPKIQSPVGNGKIICASAFLGPDVDFGNGPRLFIDNYGEALGVIDYFKEYLEDETYQKVFHNWGFDRHIFYNHDIDVRGFGADTLHLARLADPSQGRGAYSLVGLSERYEDLIIDTKENLINFYHQKGSEEDKATLDTYSTHYMKIKKRNLKKSFGFFKTLRNGGVGRVLQFPDLEEQHQNPLYIEDWVDYACFDAEITYFLYHTLVRELKRLPIRCEDYRLTNNFDLYQAYWRPFGEALTAMEREGFYIEKSHFKTIEAKAKTDRKKIENQFLEWVHANQEDAKEFNPTSSQQMQHLLFAPFKKKTRKADNMSLYEAIEAGHGVPENRYFRTENISQEIKEGRSEPLKYRDMLIHGYGIPALNYTASGMPSADASTIQALAGNPEKGDYGLAYDHFESRGMGEKGKSLCEALHKHTQLRNIDTLLNTFICPLQKVADHKSRIHCSLNINTETGRLSARRPNLQNQPALDKDIYKIRDGFRAEKGKKLVVADYGQLELRVLAHMTNCKAMIEAFWAGGDFHSRTALGMYPEIQQQLDAGNILLEWDSSKGEAPAPLIKDQFANERKKAKIMNFSIAYGKTSHGFAQDFDCTLQEAEDIVNLWYSDRPEVRDWQKKVQKHAMNTGITQTLLGRYRNLSRYFKEPKFRNAGLRAAINTPIQGGAADIVVSAMVNLYKDDILKKLGYKMLLQIHDEVVIEGPEENAEEAMARMVALMEDPLPFEFKVKLEVDACIGNSWYEAK